MRGFFAPSELVRKPVASLVPQCGACGLYRHCKSPKMKVAGKGRKGILLVGEAPGKNEDEQGLPFVGVSGKYLKDVLTRCDVDMQRDCWRTNALICHPDRNKITNPMMVDFCRPNLINTIKELQPSVIILFGSKAVESLIGWLWKEDVGNIGRWLGWQIPSQRLNAYVCPTWHPSYLLRSKEMAGNEVAERMFFDHVQEAVNLEGRPWSTVPDYRKEIEVVIDCSKAASIIETRMNTGCSMASFDFETTTLKPDSKEAWIVCCSVCLGGRETIAFPWMVPAIGAMRLLLQSDIPKVGWNVKFEQRWCLQHFDRGVKNFAFDGMLATHTLDNRQGICSLKFQAFVRLGMESYDDNIKPFLESKTSNSANRVVRDVDMKQLLEYCALDSLLEYKLDTILMKELGI